jgi:hypothetical protein
MDTPTPRRSGNPLRLSNLQVIVILLVCGALLLGGTWAASREFGYMPVSLWDICTSVLPGSDSKPASSGALSAPAAVAPVKR